MRFSAFLNFAVFITKLLVVVETAVEENETLRPHIVVCVERVMEKSGTVLLLQSNFFVPDNVALR